MTINGPILTASNIISLIRGVMSAPIAWLISIDANWLAFFLCWLAAFSDWADGYVARKTNTVSEWGKVLDPLADKILVGTIVVMLVAKGLLPLWFVLAVVARDVIIVVAGTYLTSVINNVVPSKMSGKLAVSAIAFCGVMALVGFTTARDISMVIATVLMAVSLLDYGVRFNGIIRQNKTTI